MIAWLAVALGGAIGTIIRFGLLKVVPPAWGTMPTLLANIISCLVLGYCLHKTSLVQHVETRLLLTTGLCGGMSTFSTLIYELYQYYVNGNLYQGVFYLIASIGLGIASLFVGIQLASN